MKPVTPLISFVMPFYRRFFLFKSAFYSHIHLFLNLNCEIILAMDDRSDELLVTDFMKRHEIPCRVIVNDAPHDWRPPCKAINVGVRRARGEYVAIISPETVMIVNDHRVIEVACQRDRFVGGILSSQDLQMGDKLTAGYGLLICPKETIQTIHGFDERRKFYGGDDNDIRERLTLYGLKPKIEHRIVLIHQSHDAPRRDIRDGQYEPWGKDIIIPNQENWGMDFSRIAYEN